MIIKKVNYPVSNKRKYSVIHNDKEYTCYLDCWNENFVCTGNGKTSDCKDITNTKLGMSIILECNK